jgi:hypothetical protein
VRDPLDILRATFPAGVAGYLLAGNAHGATNLAVAGAAVLVARVVNLPRLYDLCFVLAMALTGWGEALRLYDAFPWYDNLVHFLVPLLGAPVVYIAMARLDVLPDPKDDTNGRHYVGIFVVTLSFGLAIGAVWEIVEWSSDRILGSQLSLGNADTIGDLVADGLGALLGALLLVVWSAYGWGSVRRIPGENRREDLVA